MTATGTHQLLGNNSSLDTVEAKSKRGGRDTAERVTVPSMRLSALDHEVARMHIDKNYVALGKRDIHGSPFSTSR